MRSDFRLVCAFAAVGPAVAVAFPIPERYVSSDTVRPEDTKRPDGLSHQEFAIAVGVPLAFVLSASLFLLWFGVRKGWCSKRRQRAHVRNSASSSEAFIVQSDGQSYKRTTTHTEAPISRDPRNHTDDYDQPSVDQRTQAYQLHVDGARDDRMYYLRNS